MSPTKLCPWLFGLAFVEVEFCLHCQSLIKLYLDLRACSELLLGEVVLLGKSACKKWIAFPPHCKHRIISCFFFNHLLDECCIFSWWMKQGRRQGWGVGWLQPPALKKRERERRERGERKRERKKKEKSKEKGPVIPRTCGNRPLAAPSDPQTSDHNSVSISRLASAPPFTNKSINQICPWLKNNRVEYK